MSRSTSTSIFKKRLLHSFVFILALIIYPLMALRNRILLPINNGLSEVCGVFFSGAQRGAGFIWVYLGDPLVRYIGKPIARAVVSCVFRPLWKAAAFLFFWSFLKPYGLLIKGIGLLSSTLSSLATKLASTSFCQNVILPLLVKPCLRFYFTLSYYVITWPSQLLLYGLMTSIRTGLAVYIAIYQTLCSCLNVYEKGFSSLAKKLMQGIDAYSFKIPVYTQSGVHAKLFGVKAKKVPKVRASKPKNDSFELLEPLVTVGHVKKK